MQYFVFDDPVSEEVENFTLTLDFLNPQLSQSLIIDPPVTEICIVDSDGKLVGIFLEFI